MQNTKLERLVDFKGRGSSNWALDTHGSKPRLANRDVLIGREYYRHLDAGSKFRASLEAIARSPAQAASHAAVFALPRLGRAPDGLPEPANRLPANE